jgi:hypothetical protein
MGRVSVERSSRIRTPRGRDRRAVPAIPAGQSPRRPRTCFWAGGPFQQLRRLPVDNELLLELSDPPPRRSQFSLLRRREPWLDAAVDALLSPPVIHGLVADPEILGDVRDPAAARDEVKDAPTKLRWVIPSSHAVLRVARQHDIQVIRLHETRGTLSPEPRILISVRGAHCCQRCTMGGTTTSVVVVRFSKARFIGSAT